MPTAAIQPLGQALADEKYFLLALLAGFAASWGDSASLSAGWAGSAGLTIFLVLVIVCISMRVAGHAERIARKVGDPYGTMILTLSAVLVEVLVLAIVLSHTQSPTLVRDTIYSAVMLDINGILGLAALMGGLKHGEQAYNDDSARTYTAMILTAMGISMVVPAFIDTQVWRHYSMFTIGAMITLYAVFLRMQTGPHSYFFSYSYPEKRRPRPSRTQVEEPALAFSIGVLVAGVIAIGLLAETMSASVHKVADEVGLPLALIALLVAAISAGPEILTALRAALANRMQSVVNIALGASLSTVILTVPVMEALALSNDQPFQMAMTPVQTVMVVITLLVTAINLNDGQTNAIEGLTHFVLFATFIALTLLGV